MKGKLDEDRMKQAEAILGFERETKAPSLYHKLDANALSSLRSIEDKLRNEVEEAVKSNVRHKMKMGALMNEARDLFPGDNEFGKWRQEFAREILPGVAPRTLNTYMSMAREYKNSTDFVEAVGWSTARELIGAPQVVMNKVYDLVEIEGTVSAREARNIVKEEKAPSPPSTGNPPPPTQPPLEEKRASKVKVITVDEMMQLAREEKDLDARVEMLEEINAPDIMKAYAFFGLITPNDGESYSTMALDFVLEATMENIEREENYAKAEIYLELIGEDQ